MVYVMLFILINTKKREIYHGKLSSRTYSTLESLKIELQEMQKSFEMKREEFLKVQGALEMLQVLEKDKAEEDDD